MSQMFQFFGGPSQEQLRMQQEADRIAIENFLDGLSAEDMALLRNIFGSMRCDERGWIAAYYEGVLGTMLKMKFGVCAHCGVDHDAEDLAAHASADSDAAESSDSSDASDETILAEQSDNGTPSLFEEPDAFSSAPLPDVYVDTNRELIGQKGLLPVGIIEKMSEYNLDDLRDQDTGQILGFICLNCGMKYGSLDDRMLKAPDDCSGCHQKAAWG